MRRQLSKSWRRVTPPPQRQDEGGTPLVKQGPPPLPEVNRRGAFLPSRLLTTCQARSARHVAARVTPGSIASAASGLPGSPRCLRPAASRQRPHGQLPNRG